MKVMKKALIGTALVGALAIGAGASNGTLSDFYAEGNANGNSIQTGTVKLGGTTNTPIFNNITKLQPSETPTQGTDITITNAGTLDGKLSLTLSEYALTSGLKNGAPSDTDMKWVKLHFDVVNAAGKTIASVESGATKAELDNGVKTLNTLLSGYTFKSQESYTLKSSVQIVRDKAADQNGLQDLTIEGNLSWKLNQL
ncbi:hypothetical protein [Bacillus testis]|uniref:hypothetical protein n=1 Tax=Bacillus testis TaxID=1622072 RepID=UPI00067E7D1A|nr:hypothetical protein [Bacillus testis]